MTEYFYDKYELLVETSSEIEEGEEYTEPITYNMKNPIDLSGEGYTKHLSSMFWSTFENYNFYTGGRYEENQVYETVEGDIIDWKVNLYADKPSIDELYAGQLIYRYSDTTFTGEGYGIYEYKVDSLYLFPKGSSAGGYDLILTILRKLDLKEVSDEATFEEGDETIIHKEYSRGELLETDLVKNDSYPKNGPGPDKEFWWVRREKYTIPPPILKSPENGYRINEGDEFPSLIFELVEREENDSNSYHARVRISERTDFTSETSEFESKEDLTNWEYYDGNNWVSFPAGGVPANTEVKFTPPNTDMLDFGFYYWSASAFNSKWGYGRSANARLLLSLQETDRKYLLMINGNKFDALSLEVSETCNGELGQMNIELLNKNV